MKKLFILVLVLFTNFIYSQAAGSNGWLLFTKDVQVYSLRINQLPLGNSMDSILVTNSMSRYVKRIPNNYNNWDTAFGWGDHSTKGYLLSTTASSLYQPILGFTPVNPNGTALQYIAGNGSKITFPTIPAAQVNSDWNSVSGISQILNKPTIPTNTNQLVNGAGYITGYVETDPTVPTYSKGLTGFSVIKTSTDPLYKNINYTPSNAEVVTAIGFSPINPNGTSSQYITGNGTKVTFPTIPAAQVNSDWNATSGLSQILNKPTIPAVKRQEFYTGITLGTGIYSVNFSTPFLSRPNVQVNLIGGTNKETWIITSTVNGFSIFVQSRVDVLGLLPTYSVVSGRVIDVLVTEQ